MTRHVLLNNVEHKDLRVATGHSAAYGDAVMYALTFPAEFRNVQAEYPIFFRKDDASGRFQAVAMCGFEAGENLFLSEHGWEARYIPLTVARQPFLIGMQNAQDPQTGGSPVVHIDMDNPRVNASEGEPVFLEHGGVSDYLRGMIATLHTIHEGLKVNDEFMDALVEHGLLESFALDVELADGSQHRLMGFHTINEEALHALPGEVLGDLNRRHFLQPIYMTLASLSNIRPLIDRKNARLPG